MKRLILKDGTQVFEYVYDPTAWDEDEQHFVENWRNPIWLDDKGDRILESTLYRNIGDWMRSE